MTNFVTSVRHDTDKIYVRLDDAQDDRALISGRVNMLCRDRDNHARNARLMEARLLRGSTTFRDRRVVGGRPQETSTIHQGTETAEDPADSNGKVSETAGIS
uniref:Uncharacterized protein n=1 Tax=Tanacetum cinerariifolium TaxID=118510 RepID=A0A699QC90_TANCI|nr:hypothetical protein [Tanacetum cinerariifolium]